MALVGGKRRQKKKRMTKQIKQHPLIRKQIAFTDEVFIPSVGMSANFKCKNEPTHSGHNVRNGHSTGNAFCVNELARDSTVEWKPQHRKLPDM